MSDASRASVISMAAYWSLECFPDLNAEDSRSLRFCLERAADLLRQDLDRIACLERWWYSVPEEQRIQIMADVAWKRHEAALVSQ